MKQLAAILSAVVLALVPASASAQSPTEDAYGGTRVVQTTTPDALPFTGGFVVPLALAGLALAGGGVAAFRRTR